MLRQRHFTVSRSDNKLLQNHCKGDLINLYAFITAVISIGINIYKGNRKLLIMAPGNLLGEDVLENQFLYIRCEIEREVLFKEVFLQLQKRFVRGLDRLPYDFKKLTSKLEARQADLTTDVPFYVQLLLDDTPLSLLPGDLNLSVSQESGGLKFSLDYLADKYSECMILEFLDSLNELFTAIVRDPSQKIEKYPYLNEQRRTWLLRQANGTTDTAFAENTIIDLFHKTVELYPHELVYIQGSSKITYEELDLASNRLANYLIQNHRSVKERIIGVLMEPSEWMIISLLGIMKAGAAYMPIDPKSPESRKDLILLNTGIQIVITDSNYMFEAGRYDQELVVIDVQFPELDKEDGIPKINLTPDSLAYVIFTSGSTGMPQGVMIEHKGLVNMMVEQLRSLDITNNDRILNMLPFTFDVAHFHLFLCLCSGATLVQIENESTLDPQIFVKYLSDKGVTIAGIPPAFMRKIDIDLLDGVRLVYSGGERPDQDLMERLLQKGKKVFNQYGLTETSCSSLIHQLGLKMQEEVPIGKPIMNTQAYILGESGQLVPVGVTGEICIGGIGLARGYFNDPELTDKRFVTSPFDPEERLYRTGDLGRHQSDGTISFCGRSDLQVKIRGYRIELLDIKTCIKRFAGIKEVIVNVQYDTIDEPFLAAYLVWMDNVRKELNELKNFVKDNLPKHMIPSYFIPLREFPMSANGKVDFKALPIPSENSKSDDYAKPTNTIEERLLAIWTEVLPRKQIGITDNFFLIGGQSLKAIQMVTRIQEEFKCSIELGEIFSAPTIAEIAVIIDRAPRLSTMDLVSIPEQVFYEASHSQERMWMLHHISENQVAYNLPFRFYVKGSLNVEALNAAIRDVIEKHEILRTTFVQVAGKLKQVVHKGFMGFELKVRDVWKKKDAEALLRSFLYDHSEQLFNLETGPLFSVEVTKVEKQLFVVSMNMHHIISDGWSMTILLSNLQQAYYRPKKIQRGIALNSI